MVELPGLAAWAFNPVTIVTGLVLVVRDFAQREIGHEVLIAMMIALFLTYVTSGGALALASGAAFLISELVGGLSKTEWNGIHNVRATTLPAMHLRIHL